MTDVRVAIVGGGIAGVSAATALRSNGFQGDIELLDAEAFPYDRPPLSKGYLSGELSAADIALRPPEWYDAHRVRLRTHTRVTALRSGQGAVELHDGTLIQADRVILATGGSAARPPIPGADDSRVYVLRTDVDADRLRGELTPGAHLVIIGAGLIGAETASTAMQLGCEVTLIDPVAAPLASAFGADIATWLHDMHTERGITMLADTVARIEPRTGGVDVHTAGGTTVAGTAVLLAVGMVPDTALARTAGLSVEGGILVDDGGRTADPTIVAAGDAAQVMSGGALQPNHGHWDNARATGELVAATTVAEPAPVSPVPWFWTDRYDRHIEVVGGLERAQTTTWRGGVGDAHFAAFGLADGRVVGAVAVDDSAAVRAARRLIERGSIVDAAALGDPGTNLRALVR